jgi:hypothetical protein
MRMAAGGVAETDRSIRVPHAVRVGAAFDANVRKGSRPHLAIRPIRAPNTVRIDIALTWNDGPVPPIAQDTGATRSTCGSGTSATTRCAGIRASGPIVRGSAAAGASADQRERSHGNNNKSVRIHCKLPRSRPSSIESPSICIFETRLARNRILAALWYGALLAPAILYRSQ